MKITREQLEKIHTFLNHIWPGMGPQTTRDVENGLAAAGIEVEEPENLPAGPLTYDDKKMWVMNGGMEIAGSFSSTVGDAFLRWAVKRWNAERPWEEKECRCGKTAWMGDAHLGAMSTCRLFSGHAGHCVFEFDAR